MRLMVQCSKMRVIVRIIRKLYKLRPEEYFCLNVHILRAILICL